MIAFIIKYRLPVLIAVTIVLATIIGLMADYSSELKSSLKTAENNFKIIQSERDTFRTRLGRQASVSEALRLSVKQMKELRAKDVETIKDLKVKLKEADFLINIGTKTEFKYIALVKDSIIKDTVYPCIEYTDKYFHLDGCIKDEKFYGNTYFIDSLSIVGSPVRKGWWIFKKTVGAKVSIENLNPSSRIFFNEYIRLNN